MTSLRIIAVLFLISTITLCICDNPVDDKNIHFYFDDDGYVQLSPESAKGRNGFERWWAKVRIRLYLVTSGILLDEPEDSEFEKKIYGTVGGWLSQFKEFLKNNFG